MHVFLVLFLAAVRDSSDLKCYAHAVSPVKVSASGKGKYSNMTLQTSEGFGGALCFSPKKRTTLEEHQADKSLVKMSNFKFSSNYSKDNVIINRSSKIKPVGDDVGFQHVEMVPFCYFIAFIKSSFLGATGYIEGKGLQDKLSKIILSW